MSIDRPLPMPCSNRLDCLATAIVPGRSLATLRISGTSWDAASGSTDRSPMKTLRSRATKKKSLRTGESRAAASGVSGSTSQYEISRSSTRSPSRISSSRL